MIPVEVYVCGVALLGLAWLILGQVRELRDALSRLPAEDLDA